MIRAQICFSGKADLAKVRSQLEQLQKEGIYEFYHCFLPRHIVEAKGFDTAIVDMLDETLGDHQVRMLEHYETFNEAMANIEKEREYAADRVNRMFVLDSGTVAGVAKEIELFTNRKVIMMP